MSTSKDANQALGVVRHEVLHHEVAHCVQPYVSVLNAVLGAINAESHRRTELLVERLRAAMEEAAEAA